MFPAIDLILLYLPKIAARKMPGRTEEVFISKAVMNYDQILYVFVAA